jgi:hypothetical protein
MCFGKTLAIFSSAEGLIPEPGCASLKPNFGELSVLYCSEIGLLELDLSKVPKLRKFNCGFNQLTELNLSKTKLTVSLISVDPQVKVIEKKLQCKRT